MKLTDRREWLKTIGLGSGLVLAGGLQSFMPKDPSTVLNDGPVKLSSNENPFGPSAKVRNAISENFDIGCRYPSQYLRRLVDLLAAREGVSRDCIVVTGGSTEGLKAAGLISSLNADSEIIAADPTFQAMLRYAEHFGTKIHRVPLNSNLEHDLDQMSARINSKTSLVFICNPNNPTGTVLNPGKLEDFCRSHEKDTLIFSDEAYYDYINIADYPSMTKLVKEDLNVIVSRTFSKVYGLAGLRIGYLVAKPDLASRLKAVVMANTNVYAIQAAITALQDDEFYKYSLLQNEASKNQICYTLKGLGLNYITSQTNFVFFHSGRPIQGLIQDMRQENVLIGRPFPPMLNWARISTGTGPQTMAFCKAIQKVMG